ncbi:ribonuclease PH [Bradymonas sediminis]|uniref:Ribonuclease PH n=1 Tax=Bradymonas sediminis TaxID=1548548 RepID=A0A2Z4FRH6_9DELT|nr:ribonuclease PH [Bradymonas sediminis]AWV91266.1 ribonuclease PH [Bradymonas sediminis]TDP73835.1 RNAse PH [Bradymonas sediminis]
MGTPTDKTRFDGRAADELRPVTIETDFTEAPEASVLITMGKTRVLCSASVEDSVPRWMRDAEPAKGWVTAEYSMIPGATAPRFRRERRGAGGRTREIERLVGRSLRAVCDLEKLPGHTIWLDCDVLQADGGTRTAAITGAFVALALACGRLVERGAIAEMPIRQSLAAISCGVIGEQVLLDLPYEEDSKADVDMNVVMTGDGRFVEVQGTGEESTYSHAELLAMLELAGKGIAELSAAQQAALPQEPIYAKLFKKA